jgi:hypothetical protein
MPAGNSGSVGNGKVFKKTTNPKYKETLIVKNFNLGRVYLGVLDLFCRKEKTS